MGKARIFLAILSDELISNHEVYIQLYALQNCMNQAAI